LPAVASARSLPPTADSDAEQLRQLGYTSNFKRIMSLWKTD